MVVTDDSYGQPQRLFFSRAFSGMDTHESIYLLLHAFIVWVTIQEIDIDTAVHGTLVPFLLILCILALLCAMTSPRRSTRPYW